MRRLLWALCLNSIVASSAWAGPPELFTNVVDGRDESSLVVFYDYGGGGLYVSRDRGRSFGLLCSAVIEPDMRDREVWAYRERPDGRMYLGRFEGMLASDPSNCNWQRVPEFEGRWVTDIVRDAEDPNVSYAITSSGQSANGIFRNDGSSDTWMRVGEEVPLFLSRLLVVKTPDGERFYSSATVPAQTAMEKPRYSIRVSEDRGATWTDHPVETSDGSVRLLAVDPKNPDRIVVGVERSGSRTPDDVLWSSMRGQAGTFQKVGQVMTLGGAAFDDTGALFYADNEQGESAGLFRVDAPGEAPRKLSSDKIGCLRYEPAHEKLYVCRDWLFGAVDRDDGAFTVLADMRAAERFVGCPDEAGTAESCEAQFLINYCGAGHYPDAPLCQKHYGGTEGGASGAAGAGAGGALAVAGSPAGVGGAAAVGGENAGSGTAGGATTSSGSGCSVAARGSERSGASGFWLAFGMGLIMCYRVRSMAVRLVAMLAVVWLAAPSRVSAGPIELLTQVEVPVQNTDRIIARWINGDGGLYVSEDKGATFGMICYGAASPNLRGRDVQSFEVAADGGVCVGTVESLFCSNGKTCGWQEATELQGQYIADFTSDPLDPNRTYLVTGTGVGTNGVYVREMPGGMWKPFGMHLNAWFSRVHVTLNGGTRRFYVSSQENAMVEGMDGGPPTAQIRYFVRYSDDDAKTWTSHYVGEVPDRGSFRLLAVDPTNPDRIVVGHLRALENMPDDLFYSDKRGEPGSFVKIGSVIEYSSAIFTPDGTLYYGDNNQDAPALWKVANLGEAPVKLSDAYKVSCLHFDPAGDRLLVCSDWKLGTADRTTGEMTVMLDMRFSEELYECEGEPSTKQRCGVAFNPPNFCDPTHYPMSPVCVNHFGTGGVPATAGMGAGGAPVVGGMSGGAGETAGSGAISGGAASGAAGASAAGAPAGTGAEPGGSSAGGDSGGCSSVMAGRAGDAGLAWLGVAVGWAVWARRRRARLVSSQSRQ